MFHLSVAPADAESDFTERTAAATSTEADLVEEEEDEEDGDDDDAGNDTDDFDAGCEENSCCFSSDSFVGMGFC